MEAYFAMFACVSDSMASKLRSLGETAFFLYKEVAHD
jgi:hypothetical protein